MIALLGLVLVCTVTSGQTFDVVSVKRSAPDEHNSFMMRSLPGGKVNLLGVTLKQLIMQAYDIKAFQISGGPDWVGVERWDVMAAMSGVEDRLPMPTARPMIRAVLEDRFQLKAREETRQLPVYELEVDKSGSKLVTHSGSDRAFREAHGSLTVKAGRIVALAAWLSRELDRLVIDKTGLRGEYDYKMEWAPDLAQGGAESIGQPPEVPRPRIETSGPSIFTALQEQLGLRLASVKGPVPIVFINSVERPSVN